MSASVPLPPSGRDFIVYHRIVVDGATTRAVATEMNISQTRVRQIVRRMMEWLVATLPADSDLSEAAKVRLAQHIAADRLERFYVESNRAWLQTTQPKFANLCLRVIAAQSKLPAMSGMLEAIAMDAILGPLPEEASPPPARDCSAASAAAPPPAAKPTATPARTPPAPKPSSELQPAASAARQAFLRPAQPAGASGDDATVTELKITPHQLGFSTKEHLKRRERRRRRMQLSK
jgi:hypothetical protein